MNNHFLVTGATKGIGRSLVTRLLKEGCDVSFTWAASESAVLDIQSEAQQFGGAVYPYHCDLTDTDQTQRLADSLLQGTPLNSIIYCATVAFESTYTTDLTVQDWKESLNINLISPFILCSHLGPSLGSQGVIIKVSSPNATICQEGMSTYAASKAALESFSRVLARELEPIGVRVNIVRPGPTLTDGFMAQAMDSGVIAELSSATPLGRIAKPDDIADAIFALLGPDNRWVSGSILNVSGGLF